MMFFQRSLIVFGTSFIMSACNADVVTNLEITQDKQLAKEVNLTKLDFLKNDVAPEKQKTTYSSTDIAIKDKSEQMFLALSAELYNRFDAPDKSAENYKKLVLETSDTKVAQRATILAATNNQSEDALLKAKKWVQLDGEDLEANQYLALLLLRTDRFVESATQLLRIEELVSKTETEADKDSFKSLRFIGALLSVESHHKKALKVFQQYLTFDSRADIDSDDSVKAQQQLILASLAEQSGNHSIVVTALDQLDNYVRKDAIESESYIKASVMKAKALKEVQRVAEAINVLKPVVDDHGASDSIKLELVRLLIMNNQKDTAFTYLKALSEKHPQNNDLLKSLIALEIDRSNYQNATRDIQKLMLSAEYSSDAEYFMAEVLEAQGDSRSALERYMNVTSGSLLSNAKKKVARISKQLAVENETQKVNYKK